MIKNKIENNYGITLIALVITIIVMLILVGVTINISVNGGLFNYAGKATADMNFEKLKEELMFVKVFKYTNHGEKTLKQELEEKLGSDKKVEEVEGFTDVCYVTEGNTTVTVYEDGDILDGKVSIWDGTTTESPKFKEFNWYIYTPAQLKFLADFVNNENALTTEQETLITNAGYRASDVTMTESTIVYLMNNLDFGARAGTGSKEEQKWETESNEARKWTPIGIDNSTKKFIGTFEGNNHTIKGIYVNRTENFSGIFGNSNTIQNLTIADSYISGGNGTGGIVGVLRTGKIENCHNKNTTVILKEGEYRVAGGVVGQLSSGVEGAYNLSNSGKVIGYGASLITSDKLHADLGGVVGMSGRQVVTNFCSNIGLVIYHGNGNCVGGVVGCPNQFCTVNNCYNKGDISGTTLVGGVTGIVNPNVTITNCYNNGMVSGSDEQVGGIAGSLDPKNSSIQYCYNSGKINGANYIGGIVGKSEGSVSLISCYNKGIIEGTTNVGEISGLINITEESTINNLFYLTNSNRLTAIGGMQDNETDKIMGVSNDLTYDQFKTWIVTQ